MEKKLVLISNARYHFYTQKVQVIPTEIEAISNFLKNR